MLPAATAPVGGYDGDDEALFVFPDETTAMSVCFEVDEGDEIGSVLEVSGITERITLVTGL